MVIEDQLKTRRAARDRRHQHLELGIDMGAVDLVIQVESPGARVSRGLQRIGRAGHQVGEPSRGKMFPKHRGDLLEAAVVVAPDASTARSSTPATCATRSTCSPSRSSPTSPSRASAPVDEVAALVRRAANFAELTDELLANVLDLLAGRYPSDEFGELRPRLVWDRVNGTRARPRRVAQRLAVTSGGTIPDRGLFGVFLPDGTRVGELDEEMVYESRLGRDLPARRLDVADRGDHRSSASSSPRRRASPGKMPFWHGDRPGRPLELGRALGAFVRDDPRPAARGGAATRLRDHYRLDPWAAANLARLPRRPGARPPARCPTTAPSWSSGSATRSATGGSASSRPFGTPVHAPWAMAIERRLGERCDWPVEMMWSDDGIVIRLPEAADELPLDDLLIDPDEIEELVVDRAAAHRAVRGPVPRVRRAGAAAAAPPARPAHAAVAAAAARRRPAGGRRELPAVPDAARDQSRECLNDVFDLPGAARGARPTRSPPIRMVSVDTPRASPFAQSLLFGWIATYMYEGDAPLAERRAAALALDRDLLRDLLGAEELRELLDPGVLADLELELQRLADGRRARDADELHDVLRVVGDLTADECDLRAEDGPVADWIAAARPTNGAPSTSRSPAPSIADRLVAAEDAARLPRRVRVALPLGLPREFIEPVPRPLEDLIGRFARTHGPFTVTDVARRFGIPTERVDRCARPRSRATAGRARRVPSRGHRRESGATTTCCASCGGARWRSLRKEVEPVEPEVLARFLPQWHGVGLPHRRAQHLDVPASRSPRHRCQDAGGGDRRAARTTVLASPACSSGYRARPISMSCARPAKSCGSAPVPSAPPMVGSGCTSPTSWHRSPPVSRRRRPARRRAARGPAPDPRRARGVASARRCARPLPGRPTAELLGALWDLVWAGEVTNDSLQRCGPSSAGGGPKPSSPSKRTGRHVPVGSPHRPAGWRRPLEPGRAAARAATDAHRGDARHGRPAARTPRCASPARRSLAEGWPAVSPGCTACCGRWKSAAPCVAATSSPASALPSSPCPAPSTGCAPTVAREVDAAERAMGGPGVTHDAGDIVVLAATDPAQIHGAALPWPDTDGRPSRSAGAVVIQAGGRPLVWFDTRSHHLVGFAAAYDDTRWAEVLATIVPPGSRRKAEVRKVDGGPIDSAHPLVAALLAPASSRASAAWSSPPPRRTNIHGRRDGPRVVEHRPRHPRANAIRHRVRPCSATASTACPGQGRQPGRRRRGGRRPRGDGRPRRRRRGRQRLRQPAPGSWASTSAA